MRARSASFARVSDIDCAAACSAPGASRPKHARSCAAYASHSAIGAARPASSPPRPLHATPKSASAAMATTAIRTRGSDERRKRDRYGSMGRATPMPGSAPSPSAHTMPAREPVSVGATARYLPRCAAALQAPTSTGLLLAHYGMERAVAFARHGATLRFAQLRSQSSARSPTPLADPSRESQRSMYAWSSWSSTVLATTGTRAASSAPHIRRRTAPRASVAVSSGCRRCSPSMAIRRASSLISAARRSRPEGPRRRTTTTCACRAPGAVSTDMLAF